MCEHNSYVWTQALCGKVFVSAQELALKSRFPTLIGGVSYISSRYIAIAPEQSVSDKKDDVQ